MRITIHADGSWDLTGEYFSVEGMFPSLDGCPVRPIHVEVLQDHTIIYELEKGTLSLSLRQEGAQISVSCRLQGMPGVHDVEPAGGSLLCPERDNDPEDDNPLMAFVQGLGMEGPSGCRRVEEKRLHSHGLTALYKGEQILLFYVLDHRNFTNRYSVSIQESSFGQKTVQLECGFNLESTKGDDLALPPIYIEESAGLPLGTVLRNCAAKIADFMGAPKLKPPAYNWCSWYYHYQNMNQALLEEYAANLKQSAPGLQYIQLDAGYCPSLGDWLQHNHLFPEGLKKAAETILKSGYLPGIWIGPFMVGDQSTLFREHPDWILYDRKGEPVTMIKSYNEPKAWGNPDGNYYVLDASHPEALGYLRKVFHTLHEWGFRLFKTDFMLWNMIDSATVKRSDPSKTSVEILRATLKMIREEIGEESYLLGCIAPFLPFIGYADGMRIAGDVGAQWEGAYGPVNLLQEIQADCYFQNLYWQNDTDAMLLRDFDVFLKPKEEESLALLQAVSGGVVTTSDPLHRLSDEKQKLFRFLRPGKKHQTPSFPYLGKNREELVLTHHLEQGNLLFVMNPTEREMIQIYTLEELFGKNSWYVRRWHDAPAREPESGIIVRLKPHESALFFLTEKPLTKEPDNLWDW